MNKFAIIETGGKQYRVKSGDKLKVEKLELKDDKKFSFDKVLFVSDGENVKVGKPYLANSSVESEIVSAGRHDKKITFRYHSKTRYRKLKGSRQEYTEVLIGKIN